MLDLCELFSPGVGFSGIAVFVHTKLLVLQDVLLLLFNMYTNNV